MQSKIKCPVCKGLGLRTTFRNYNIPHFGETLISLTKCSKCRYKHADTLILEEGKPVEYTLKIEREKDMSVKIIRSSQATLEIPEFGVKISPGSHSEGYITNVEGVLERIKDIIEGRMESSDKTALKKARELIKKIDLLKEGKSEATLHLLDPTGNSAIVSKKVVKE